MTSNALGGSDRRSDVSVIVPTCDDGDLLCRCLASIEAQTIAPLEVIVVDDGTTRPEALHGIDQAGARYPWVKLVRQQNAGPSAARNRGAALCSGRWIAFVDADDELPPESLAARRAIAGHDPRTVAAFGGVTFVEPDGRRWRAGYHTDAGPFPLDRLGDRDGIPGFLWAYLIRADAYRAAGGLDEGLRIMEDFDLLARLGRAGGWLTGTVDPAYVQHRRLGSLARGSARRQMAGALRFLAKARRQRYFSRSALLRRYLRVPIGALKVLLRYSLRR